MASRNFTHLSDAFVEGKINYRTATFKCLLMDNTTIPSESELDTWIDRADVLREHAVAGNYVAGGFAVTATVEAVPDTTNNNIEITFAETTSPAFSASTIASKGAILYLSTGVAADDLLICFVDFGGEVISTVNDFTVTFDTALPINV